jgi:hypothetical protein
MASKRGVSHLVRAREGLIVPTVGTIDTVAMQRRTSEAMRASDKSGTRLYVDYMRRE